MKRLTVTLSTAVLLSVCVVCVVFYPTRVGDAQPSPPPPPCSGEYTSVGTNVIDPSPEKCQKYYGGDDARCILYDYVRLYQMTYQPPVGGMGIANISAQCIITDPCTGTAPPCPPSPPPSPPPPPPPVSCVGLYGSCDPKGPPCCYSLYQTCMPLPEGGGICDDISQR